MQIFGIHIGGKKQREVKTAIGEPTTKTKDAGQPQRKAFGGAGGGYGGIGGYGFPAMGNIQPPVIRYFGGEVNDGEMGPPFRDVIDHDVLGIRAWQEFLTNTTVKSIISKKTRFKISTGLTPECEPITTILESRGINIDVEEFNENVEALWKALATNFSCDYAKRANLGKIARRADINKSLRGDVLIVLRVDDKFTVNMQLIDGCHVSTPIGLSYISMNTELVDNQLGYDWMNTETGNRVRWGVEIADTGEHMAYWVCQSNGISWKRIEAKDSMGNTRAYLAYGSEYRLDNIRGIPDITSLLETSAQLRQYVSATVGSAVERQKVAYWAQHEKGTGDEDISGNFMAQAVGIPYGSVSTSDNPETINGQQLADKVRATTNKQLINTPEGTDLKVLESEQELYFDPVYNLLSNAMCANADTPPELVKMMFGNSYSASRAAMNIYQVVLDDDVTEFGTDFYKHYHNLQFTLWVLSGKLDAPGYIDAYISRDEDVLNAYRNVNWIGKRLPAIDMYKDLQAIRLLVGEGSKHLPFGSMSGAAKLLGVKGNWDAIAREYSEEMQLGDALGIEKVEERGMVIEQFDAPGEDEPGKPGQKNDDAGSSNKQLAKDRRKKGASNSNTGARQRVSIGQRVDLERILQAINMVKNNENDPADW